MNRKIFVFGNEFISEDSFAVEIAKSLGVVFVHCRSPDELLGESDIVILDVVKGISDVVEITDVSKLKVNKLVSAHDFDLGYYLNLMKEMGQLKRVVIIGVPEKGDKREIVIKVKGMLDRLWG